MKKILLIFCFVIIFVGIVYSQEGNFEKNNDKYMLALTDALHLFIESDNLRSIEGILEKHPNLVNKRREYIQPRKPVRDDHFSPIQRAAEFGRYKIARYLIERGANVNEVGGLGWTALHEASVRGYYEIVKLLIENGADVNAKYDYVFKEYELHISMSGDFNTPTNDMALIDEEVINRQEGKPLNWTPIHLAAREGHIDIVKLLIKHGSDRNLEDSEGNTPLDLAERENHNHIVIYLKKLEQE